MWAQLQRVMTKPDTQAELLAIFDQLQAAEQDGSGLLQTVVLRSQADPRLVFVLVLFESEQQARAREHDPRREDAVQRIRASMAGVLDGPPEFFDCDVLLSR